MPIRLAGKGYLVIGLVKQPPLGQWPEEMGASKGPYHTHGMKGAKLCLEAYFLVMCGPTMPGKNGIKLPSLKGNR